MGFMLVGRSISLGELGYIHQSNLQLHFFFKELIKKVDEANAVDVIFMDFNKAFVLHRTLQ